MERLLGEPPGLRARPGLARQNRGHRGEKQGLQRADADIGVQRWGRLLFSSPYEIKAPLGDYPNLSAFFGTNIVSKKLHRRRVGRLTIGVLRQCWADLARVFNTVAGEK